MRSVLRGSVATLNALLRRRWVAVTLGGAVAAVVLRATPSAHHVRDARTIDGHVDGISHSISHAELAQFEVSAKQAVREGRLSIAERNLRKIMEARPDDVGAIQQLARLLRLEGRRWESVPLFLELIRRDVCDVEELVLLGGIELEVEVPAEFLSDNSPAARDPLVLLWQAQQSGREDESARTEALLRSVLASSPGQIEAQARLGALLLEAGDSAPWLAWHAQLPGVADEHPEIWALRGIWAQNQDELHVAVRCLWEAVRRDPDHRTANYRLSQVLTALGLGARGELFVERARELQELETELYALDKHPHDLEHIRRAAELSESLGRAWEANAWCRAALRRNPRSRWASDGVERLRPLLNDDLPRVVSAANPALLVDLSSYPLPKWDAYAGRSPTRPAAENMDSLISFEDVAVAAGIRFSYFNGGSPETEILRMYEFTGGGVAVLDYDEDGWPDLYFSQGCAWPPNPGQTRHLDRLYRNLGTGAFRDVTAEAVLGDERFSQGATVGDFDDDGFADLYVANIGGNRLYRNQGDGTYTDISDASKTGGKEWTVSCLMADLNGDGWPDLFCVNYLGGSDVFSRLCRQNPKRGALGVCAPVMFPGEQNRVYLNLGDGCFDDATDSSGIVAAEGKGLGIVAADFDGSGQLNLYIANDKVPNFYFVNQTEFRGAPLRFSERGQVTGLAYDQDGATKAGMGVAAGDVDGDGMLDLLVTNFYRESVTLYRQHPGGFFVDETRRSGLREPTSEMLGFGAQFLDGDLDGLPDLVISNGHVDNYTVSNEPYQMRPQFFRNIGDGRFRELSAQTLGAYFSRSALGRGLARLDWNRDGREDFVVSHLDAPVALLSNQSPATGHFLAVRLRGVKSDRDAIGATVRVAAGATTHVRQLTAGDGYAVSNQRLLIFGLGDSARIDTLTVRWPSGFEQTIRDLAVDQEIILVEGSPRAARMVAR